MNKKRAIVRGIADSFLDAASVYFGNGPTDLGEAKSQHANYVASLRKLGVEVTEIPADDDYPDCCFVEDQVVVANDKGLLTVSGRDLRRGERGAIENALKDHLDLSKMSLPAHMDGGDVVEFGDTFLVGISSRTNREGAQALRDMVSPLGFKVHEIPIPSNALHLISICSSPADGMLLAPQGYLNSSDFPSDAELLWVPEEEVYAANVIGFGNDVLCAAGYPKTHKLLEDKGFCLHPIDMSQIRSADGSLTCLSVFY